MPTSPFKKTPPAAAAGEDAEMRVSEPVARRGVLRNGGAEGTSSKAARLEGFGEVSPAPCLRGRRPQSPPGFGAEDFPSGRRSRSPPPAGGGSSAAAAGGSTKEKSVFAKMGLPVSGTDGNPMDLDPVRHPKIGGQEEEEPSEPSLRSVMQEIQKLSLSVGNVGNKFDAMQSSVDTLRTEFASIKEDMITKPVFESLANRVEALEKKSTTKPEGDSDDLKLMRQQIMKLDPANRSIRCRGFKSENLTARLASIQAILDTLGVKYASAEHIFKGPSGQRTATDMCIIEFSSNSVREQILKELLKKTVKDDTNAVIVFDRAKTTMQLQRNAALRRAMDTLKKHRQYSDRDIKIFWKKENSNDKRREVHVDGIPAFLQNIDDLSGTFVAPFNFLS